MKNKLKRILDIVMTLMLPCLMAYELIGQGTHEILGLCMVSLFILHHVMNGQWHIVWLSAVLREKYAGRS